MCKEKLDKKKQNRGDLNITVKKQKNKQINKNRIPYNGKLWRLKYNKTIDV